MAINRSNSSMSNKKVIKPLYPENVIFDNIKYSSPKFNTEAGTKWIDTTYGTDSMLVIARKCIVKTAKKTDNKDKNGKVFVSKDGKPREDKYQIFMGIKDEHFIKFINDYQQSLLQTSIVNSEQWFDEQFNDEECKAMLKTTLSVHEKFGTAIGGLCGRDFICKSQTEDVSDVSDILVALQKGTEINVCFKFNKIKLGVGNFNIGFEISQINIINVGIEYIPFNITKDTYVKGNITLNKQQQHEKGGKFCNVLYELKPLRIHIENNIKGRIFKNISDDGQISYSISIRLTDLDLRTMIENIEQEIFDLLLTNSKDYFGAKKTSKLLKAVVKTLISYNKQDQEKIKKGEQPTYDPSMWIKIYWTSEKGFDGKVINSLTEKPFLNPDEIINTNLSLSSLDIYSRHIWFGPKGTSINFTLNKCVACSENAEHTEYDMDSVATNNNTETITEVIIDENANNSDND